MSSSRDQLYPPLTTIQLPPGVVMTDWPDDPWLDNLPKFARHRRGFRRATGQGQLRGSGLGSSCRAFGMATWVVFALGFSSVEAPFVRDPGEAAVYRAGNGGYGIDAPEHFSCTPDNCRIAAVPKSSGSYHRKLHHRASLVSCLEGRSPCHGRCRSASTTRENAAEDCRRLG